MAAACPALLLLVAGHTLRGGAWAVLLAVADRAVGGRSDGGGAEGGLRGTQTMAAPAPKPQREPRPQRRGTKVRTARNRGAGPRLQASRGAASLAASIGRQSSAATGRGRLNGTRGAHAWSDGPPRVVERDGRASVWSFRLRFSHQSAYWRNFTVEAAEACARQRCALLVDFHPYESDSKSEREWMQWSTFQAATAVPFVVLTPDGSSDGYPGSIPGDARGWNVLGWGKQAPPASHAPGRCAAELRNATCLDWAVNRYGCYASQMERNPAACLFSRADPSTPRQLHFRLVTRRIAKRRRILKSYSMDEDSDEPANGWTSNTCATMSAQDDSSYLASVLHFVVKRYRVDPRRIYFFGQSQGGMAALSFAAPGVLPEALRPAAIVVGSAAAARSHSVDLGGSTAVLLLHGARDDIVPPTIWSGVARNTSFLTSTQLWFNIVQAHQEEAQGILRRHSNDSVPAFLNPSVAVIWANALTGGKLLRRHQKRLAHEVGCTNAWGESTVVSSDGYLYDPFSRTLSGVAGKEVDMAALHFEAPQSLPPAARRSIQCASVRGTAAPVRVCIFNGGHCLPWQHWEKYNCTWTKMSDHGRVFQNFVWQDFLQGGLLARAS
mmetsp:Transcript_50289/g.155697  ORF Transcript_50289/g.155697 Transcript_50289/m.155697 type:complete len:609 (+) Transcript_50289:1-1827(+)